MGISIFICEDDNTQRMLMESTVFSHALQKGYDMEIALCTGDPTTMLSYLDMHPQQKAIYFLDIDLQHQINGIDIARKIREFDPVGWIIFVTTHAELSYLTFRHRIEAMDYIIKDNRDSVVNRIRECIDIARSRFEQTTPETEYFRVKSSMGIQKVPISDILYFETHHVPHKLVLHTLNKRIEFRGSLKKVADISPHFFICHKAYVVNTSNIVSINRIGYVGEAEMINGLLVPVSKNRITLLNKIIKA